MFLCLVFKLKQAPCYPNQLEYQVWACHLKIRQMLYLAREKGSVSGRWARLTRSVRWTYWIAKAEVGVFTRMTAPQCLEQFLARGGNVISIL